MEGKKEEERLAWNFNKWPKIVVEQGEGIYLS